MKTKFEVGDIVQNIEPDDHFCNWEVIDIIFERQKVPKMGRGYFENCYAVSNPNRDDIYYLLPFEDEDKFYVINSSKNKSITTSSCPVCGGELKDKFSEYVGGNINKCKSCGWC